MNTRSRCNCSEKSTVCCFPNRISTSDCSHRVPQQISTVWYPSSTIRTRGLSVVTTPTLIVSTEAGNSPRQPATDMVSMPFSSVVVARGDVVTLISGEGVGVTVVLRSLVSATQPDANIHTMTREKIAAAFTESAPDIELAD